MSSPPPVPSAKYMLPFSEFRFKGMMDPTEYVEDYRPGHYHPVHLGDSLRDSRYEVLRKLGYGSFSTVWLAKDHLQGTYVAVKILTARTSVSGKEVEIFQQLSLSEMPHPGRKHVMKLLDMFWHIGPNGKHQCLVFEVMGPSVASMVETLQMSSNGLPCSPRLPLWIARSILQQTLLGLDFLHSNRVAHGDLQPGNILMPVKDLNAIDEAHLVQQHVDKTSFDSDHSTTADDASDDYLKKRGISQPIRRLDGKVDLWAPKYLVYDQSLADFAYLERDFKLKISDLGATFPFDQPPDKPVTPFSLRSPEAIVTGRTSKDQDIWSFGCLLFEILTGRPLFCVDSFTFSIPAPPDDEKRIKEDPPPDGNLDPDSRDVNDDHMLQLTDVLGPIPESLRSRWKRSPIYFDSHGRIIKHHIGKLPKGYVAEQVWAEATLPPLKDFFDREKPAEMDPAEAELVKDLLGWILQYDPSNRPSSSEELLQHEWFRGGLAGVK